MNVTVSSLASPSGAGTHGRPPYRPWIHRLAIAAAAVTWPLLMVGGTVTVMRAGMAVYDWPTTFGLNMFLFNMFEATWGVFVEHGHRLYGSLVGLGCVLLACWFTLDRLGKRGLGVLAVVLGLSALAVMNPATTILPGLKPGQYSLVGIGLASLPVAAYFIGVRRDWPAGLAWLALAGVVGQGLLGGYRVNLNSARLAFIHGCTAQAFFGLMVALAVLTGQRWMEAGDRVPDRYGLRVLGPILLVATYAQIVLGATVRHYLTSSLLIQHAIASLLVATLGMIAGARARRASADCAALGRVGPTLVGLVSLQMLLGVLNWWIHPPFDGVPRPGELTRGQAVIRLSHQGLGALVLAAAVVLVLRSYRHLSGRTAAAGARSPQDTDASVRRPLETVA